MQNLNKTTNLCTAINSYSLEVIYISANDPNILASVPLSW